MPRLLAFVACERVILDTEGLASLIRVIESVEVTVPKEVELPPGISAPKEWSTISIWSLDRSETGLYEQQTEMVTGDGIIAMHTEPRVLESTIPSVRTGAKIVSALYAIPIVEGRLELRLSYRKVGDPEWMPAATYPIEVTLVRQ
jgi:hypothetical protein